MWNPPIALSAAEQTIAARTRKARKFFVFLRECRHELLDADFQHTLTESYSSGSGGHEPVEAGLLALATLLQGYCHVGDRDAVELAVMDKRWQMVLDCLGAEQPPFSQGTLFNFRMRLIAHNLEKTLLDRTVALAEKTGGFGARQLRAVLDSTPLFGASRVEDTLNLLGHALRKAVGLAAQVLDTSAEAVAADAGLTLLGHSSLKAALDLDWGEPSARERALGLVLEEVGRWQRWLEQQHALATQAPPIKEVMAVLCHEGLPLRQKGWPFLPHRDKNGIKHGCWECSTGLDKRSTEYYVDTIMRPAVSQNSHFAKRFAEIVSKTCREEQGTEVFHAHIWQKSVSVFAAKVCGNMCDPRQRFPATPSRHAGDVQRHRQARNSLQ